MFIKLCILGTTRKLSSKRQLSCQPADGQSWLAQKLTRYSTNVNHIPSVVVAQYRTTAQQHVQPGAVSFSDIWRTEGKFVLAYVKEKLSIFWKYLVGVDKRRYGSCLQNVPTELRAFRPTIVVFWQDVHCSSVLAICRRCPLSHWTGFTVSYWLSAQVMGVIAANNFHYHCINSTIICIHIYIYTYACMYV